MNWLPTCDAEETDALFSLPEMLAVQRGARLTVLSQTDSTNHVLRDLVLAGAPQGQAVISLEQSAGKGRQGKRFFSPRGGLYLSYYMDEECVIKFPFGSYHIWERNHNECAKS